MTSVGFVSGSSELDNSEFDLPDLDTTSTRLDIQSIVEHVSSSDICKVENLGVTSSVSSTLSNHWQWFMHEN
jgi:hypothetical protein